jgi:hypothetical protein
MATCFRPVCYYVAGGRSVAIRLQSGDRVDFNASEVEPHLRLTRSTKHDGNYDVRGVPLAVRLEPADAKKEDVEGKRLQKEATRFRSRDEVELFLNGMLVGNPSEPFLHVDVEPGDRPAGTISYHVGRFDSNTP